MIRNLLPALTLGALLALVGCAAQPQVIPGQASADPAAAAPTSTYTPPTYSPPAAQQATNNIGTLGVDTFTYADGLVVGVSKAQVYTPGRYAAGHDNAVGVRLDVTVTNNGSKVFDPTLFQVNASYAGQPASQIFDSANGLGVPPQTKLRPGKSITFPVAFSIVDGGGELQIDVQPSFRHNSSIFVGPVG
jgi:hypothetical protein